jgi:hypothetical protein
MQKNWKPILGLVLTGILVIVFGISCFKVSAEMSDNWFRNFDGGGDDEALGVAVAKDGYVMVGITNSSGFGQYDAWLIKIDSSGMMEWSQNYGGMLSDAAYSVVATTDSGYVLAGSTSSFGMGSADFWLIKVDSTGSIEWNHTYGGEGYESCRSMISTSDGGYALLGFTAPSDTTNAPFGLFGSSDVLLVKVDPDGNMEWNQTYGGAGLDSVSAIIETADGGFILGCSTTSFGMGSADFWLIKVDSTGSIEWNYTYGGAGTEFSNSLVATVDGGYVLAGSTSSFGAGSADVFLVKVDTIGNLEWNQTYGGEIADYCDSIAISCDGDYMLACVSQPPVGSPTPPYGDGVFWLIEVDSQGNLKWNQTYGVSAHHSHTSLLTTSKENYIFGGTREIFILGGSTRDERGTRDFLLAEISEAETDSDLLIYLVIPIAIALVLMVALIYRRNKNPQKQNSITSFEA